MDNAPSNPGRQSSPPSGEPADALSAAAALMQGLIDYAGLFPPAKLAMLSAMRAYATHLASPDAWMLGRFIIPVSRLQEFSSTGKDVLPCTDEGDPWPMSVIIDGPLADDMKAIAAFNQLHGSPDRGLAFIDAVEIRVPLAASGQPDSDFIDHAIDLVPDELFAFFEIPILPGPSGGIQPDPRGCIAVLSGLDAGAKLRTGGVTPDAIPSPKAVAEFILACAAGDVPFKATAGLHHLRRAEQALTYEPGCTRAVMHGYLNVFVAAAAAFAGRDDHKSIERIIATPADRPIRFEHDRLLFDGLPVLTEHIEAAREMFSLSYGSCSFDEPVNELRAVGGIK